MVLILLFVLTFFGNDFLFNWSCFAQEIKLFGYDIKSYSGNLEHDANFRPIIEVESTISIRMFGLLDGLTRIALSVNTTECKSYPDTVVDVQILQSKAFVDYETKIPYVSSRNTKYLFCTYNGTEWTLQDSSIYIIGYKPLVQPWMGILLIVFCVLLSSILNGLALGLMTLSITDLQVFANAGNEKEKRYGKTILTVRSKGNYLLISLVIGSTMANAVMTIFIDYYVNNWITIALTTVIIVLFCEILPCTIVPRWGLSIGANTIYITRFFMILTFPISYPLGKFLDYVLGVDFNVYSRERIKEMVKITSKFTNMKKLEADVITGALEMSNKNVDDVMTPIQDVYMLSIDTYLDYRVIGEIIRSGYSRIPIYEGEKNNIVKILHVRDLALLDPDDRTSMRLFCQLIKTELIFIDEGSPLDEAFNIFKEGVKGHMAFVCSKQEGNNTLTCNVLGLVTLEDIIEELVQVEIMDEFDSVVDNRSKRKRERMRLVADYLTTFADVFDTQNVFIPAHLKVATFQFLVSEIPQFHSSVISPKVLRRLLSLGSIVHLPSNAQRGKQDILFSQEKAPDGFVMIIEGRAIIILGPDNLKFECGPFSYFGLLSLDSNADIQNKYDYTVVAVGEVRYLRIPRDLYEAAKKATELELRGEEAPADLSEELYPGLFRDAESDIIPINRDEQHASERSLRKEN